MLKRNNFINNKNSFINNKNNFINNRNNFTKKKYIHQNQNQTKKTCKKYCTPTKIKVLEYMDNDELHKFQFLVMFLARLFASRPKKDVINCLKGYRNRDVIIPYYVNDKTIQDFYNKFKLIELAMRDKILESRETILNKQINNKQINNEQINQTGGYYFKRLEEKGDQPITGEDISRLLDEIQGITGNLRYVPEGRDLTTFDVLLSFFRGDEESLKTYAKFFIAPRFYQVFPPQLKYIFSAPKPGTADYEQFKKFAGGAPLIDRYEDLGDYMLAYQSYKNAKNQYYIDQGMISPDVLEPTFFDRLTQQIDKVATRYSMAKMQMNPRRMIIM